MALRNKTPTRRARRRYDREAPVKVITRGLLVVGLLGALLYLAVKAYDGVPGKSYDYVEASLPEVGNLIPHDPVRIGGKRVGQVSEIGAGEDGRALVRLQLEPDTGLTSDSRILLRANGLLGARYVELIPGRSRDPLGDKVIEGDESTLTYGVTEALDVFDRDTRGELRNMVGELGTGLLGQGRALNAALDEGGDAIVPFQRLMGRLLDEPDALERLLPSLDSALRPLDASRRPLARVPGAAADALRPLAEEEDAVRGTLREAPSALAAADDGLTRGRVLLAAARSLATEANATLPKAPGGLRAAAALLRESPRPLRRARALLRTARPAVPSLLRITSGVSPLLRPLDELFSDLTPIFSQVGRYECDIENFGAVFRSMTGFGGFGEGPNGPAMGFRLQAAAPVPTEALSVKDSTGLAKREGYVEPCKYLAKPYLIVERPGGAR